MQKNQRSSIFFLISTFKTQLNNHNKNNHSKKLNKTISAGLILTIGVFSLAFIGYFTFTGNKTIAQDQIVQPVQSNNPTAASQKAEYKSINYDRPASENAKNSGGPNFDYKLTVESESEENAMESQIRLIETTSNPAFLPTVWAHLGKINNEFGYRRNPFGGRSYEFHSGMDIDGDTGDMIVAPANGIVTEAGWQGGYGNMIEIDHGNGLVTRYGHLSRIGVSAGDAVMRGQIIGLIGSTGRSTGPHLHYELRLNDKPINPRRLLPPEPSAIKSFGN